jgi:hypothetical protein
MGAGPEGDEDVHVAVRAEVVAEHGAEEGQVGDAPAPAEGGQPLPVERESPGEARAIEA